ncbi:MAG: NAD(P)-binding protein [Deltaproteobacteria bacterium]|nr:NAD(P)-binding protein [Deltaproteobacteria bacterium]
MRTIKILGAGIAGLTAAINLKNAGVDVEVHERKTYCGKSTCDFQLLENWTFEEDALEMLQNLSIKTNFYAKPWHSLELTSPSLKTCLKKSSQPLMYLVKRGPVEDALDYALQKQAEKINIPVIYESKLSANDVNIIAIGRHNPNYVANGIIFSFDHPDRVIALLDDRLSFKMYAYFIVDDHIGQIVSINPAQRKDHITRFNLTVKRFEEILNQRIGPINHRFAAAGSLHVLNRAKINHRYLIGEAAGFQDCLAGFGMMYAFKSGYHAAQSIIKDDDFDRRWQSDMLKTMRISQVNRLLFEKLSNNGYEKLVKMLNSRNPAMMKLLGGEDLQYILKKLYNHSLSYLLRPVLYWRFLAPLYRFLLTIAGRMFFK